MVFRYIVSSAVFILTACVACFYVPAGAEEGQSSAPSRYGGPGPGREYGYRQSSGDETEVPPGMESVRIGTTTLILPRGLRVKKEGGRFLMEEFSEYTTRRFVEMERELAGLKEREEGLKSEIEELKRAVGSLKGGVVERRDQ
ncbi:MAG: hypothetical protein WCV56_03435 [Candidatus Omnitrophota bacterium]